jgi:hypothetical protein
VRITCVCPHVRHVLLFNKMGAIREEYSLLENRTFVPGTIFHLYRVFLAPVEITTFVPDGSTTRYKCPLTGACRRHLPPTQYKYLTFVPGGGSARYKHDQICTGPCGGPVQMCNDYFSFFPSPSPPPPPHFSSSSLQLELPLPNGALGSFCPIYDNFSLI